MLVGSTEEFALESHIERAYERRSLLALGFLRVHVAGVPYGSGAADATMLACAADSVAGRLATQGTHQSALAGEADARALIEAAYASVHGDDVEWRYLGWGQRELEQHLVKSGVMWAPGGDEEFDDGSVILQFDLRDSVRIVAGRPPEGLPRPRRPLRGNGPQCTDYLIRDVTMSAEAFYGVLALWHARFLSQWAQSAKVPREQ